MQKVYLLKHVGLAGEKVLGVYKTPKGASKARLALIAARGIDLQEYVLEWVELKQ